MTDVDAPEVPTLVERNFDLLHGRPEPPVKPVPLRAGPVSAEYLDAELRHLRVHGVEFATRIYMAVRDHNWDTVPHRISNVVVRSDPDSFAVTFDVENLLGPIHLRWHGTFAGDPSGAVTCSLKAAALSDFSYCKIGFNIHHPLSCAGRTFRSFSGSAVRDGEFPFLVEPQLLDESGRPTPLFEPFDRLAVDLDDDRDVEFTFTGDLFEMQDHRNWTDGNYKTYGTPLALGFPFDAQRGDAFRQAIRMVPRVAETAEPHAGERADDIQITVDRSSDRVLPRIGVQLASEPHSPRELELLRLLALDHLRVTVDAATTTDELARARDAAAQVGALLELACFFGDDVGERRALCDRVAEVAPSVARVLAFSATSPEADPALGGPLRERLAALFGDVQIAIGSDANFAELNRAWPTLDDADAVVFSMTAQVHAFDEESIVESLLGQVAAVVTARSHAGEKPIVVSPIVLRQRFNPVATGASVIAPGALPEGADRRQPTLFGAAWTLGSLSSLIDVSVASCTYFETVGWRGVIDDVGRVTTSDGAPSPGPAFPVYHVLRDVLELRGHRLFRCIAGGEPGTVAAIGGSSPSGAERYLIANLAAVERSVSLAGVAEGAARLRRLNDETAQLAIAEPARFRATGDRMLVTGPRLSLSLAPYEVLSLTYE